MNEKISLFTDKLLLLSKREITKLITCAISQKNLLYDAEKN